MADFNAKVNRKMQRGEAIPDTPLLYMLANDLALQWPRFGCGLAQCGSCSVLLDGVEVRPCQPPISAVGGRSVTTREALAAWYEEQHKLASVPALHPGQQAVIEVQAPHCGYCLNGMLMKGSEFLSRKILAQPKPGSPPPWTATSAAAGPTRESCRRSSSLPEPSQEDGYDCDA